MRPSSLSDLAAKAAKAHRVLGRLGLGQKAVPVGDGFCGASAAVGSGVQRHSLGKCLFLHLAPGVANIAATSLGLGSLSGVNVNGQVAFH